MLVKVAWRNIWRNKVRSGVVITAMALGLWAGIFASAFVNGMMSDKIDQVIESEISHLQFHAPGFLDENTVGLTVPHSAKIMEELGGRNEVLAATSRTIGTVMIGSANYNGGARAVGIDPEQEAKLTRLNDRLVEGEYFKGVKRNPVLISRKIAEKYKVKLRSKIILTFQDVNGEIVPTAFKVVGIYESANPMYDEANIFIRKADFQRLAGLGNNVHEIAVLLSNHDLAEPFAKEFSDKYPDVEVLPWLDLQVGFRYMVEAIGMYTVFIVGIILLALLFSIVNTMLMAVLERVREIGMLMAIGMGKGRVFSMIMIETVMLTLIGGPIGLLISKLSISYFGENGINLGDAAYGDMGFSNIIYPQLPTQEYVSVTIMVVIMAILAAIYPARKALKLKPVEAIRKI